MILKIIFQEHLARAHKYEDNGDLVFFICKSGLEESLGKKFEKHDEILVDVDIKIKELLKCSGLV